MTETEFRTGIMEDGTRLMQSLSDDGLREAVTKAIHNSKVRFGVEGLSLPWAICETCADAAISAIREWRKNGQ